MEKEIYLMKGNEALAHAAVRCGCDAYFGYPITPQSEVLETFAEIKPWETTGNGGCSKPKAKWPVSTCSMVPAVVANVS